MKTILDMPLHLTAADSQKNIPVPFFLSEDAQTLYLRFSYAPKTPSDTAAQLHMIKENIVQSIFCADAGTFTPTDARMIDCSPLNWESVNPHDNIFFQRIRHYMIVLRDGVLPVKFIRPV